MQARGSETQGECKDDVHWPPSREGSCCQPPALCHPRSLSLKPNLLDQQIGLSDKKTGLRSSGLSVQCPVGGSLPRAVSLIVTILGDPGTHPWLQGQVIKGCPLGNSCKNWGTWKSSPPGDTGPLPQGGRESVKVVPTRRRAAVGECTDYARQEKGEKRRQHDRS